MRWEEIPFEEDKLNQPDIGIMFGVDSNAIGLIKRNLSYPNVCPELREKVKSITPNYSRKSNRKEG